MDKVFYTICEHCSNKSKIEWDKNQINKVIQFKCKECKNIISTKFPIHPYFEDGTLVYFSMPKKKTTVAKLVVVANEHYEGGQFVLNNNLAVVGRMSNSKNPDVAIPTKDKKISRLHFIIRSYQKDDESTVRYTLEPRLGTNAVYLNNTIIKDNQELYLANKDRIKVGNTEIIFVALFKD
ncbi:MAG: FHA domain-containing protein [Saprospiraceae bacterium]